LSKHPQRKGSRLKPASRRRWLLAAVCISLALGVWAIFGQTLGFGFVEYDDNEYVYENPQITHGLNPEAILWAFTHVHSANWHPITTLTHMFDCEVYGLHPWGHHLGNMLLHSVAAILLFLLLQQMTGALWRSAFVAAVFAVHPLHVESVAWISERKDVLSGVFFMLTLMAYCRYAPRQKSAGTRSWSFFRSPAYWVALMVFALGLMSKPMLVTLPFVLLLLDYWPLQRFTLHSPRSTIAQLLLEKVPFLLLTAVSCIATIWAQKDAVTSLEKLNFPLRISNALVSYAVYVWQMIHPVGLAVIYPHPGNHMAPWKIGVSALFLLLVSAGVAAGTRKHPFLLVGWLWYLGMLVPVIGLMQVGTQAMADRYTYLPQIGLYIIVAWGAVQVCGSWRYSRLILAAGGAAIIASLLLLAYVQTSYWKNGVTLMTHALACNSNNSLAHNNLGVALTGQGQVAEAIQHYERAVKLDPNDAQAYYNLGSAWLEQGKLAEAIENYEQAIKLKPDYAEAYNNLGVVLARQRELPRAIQEYERAIQLKPDYAEAYYNLGLSHSEQGKLPEAVADYEQAIKLKPDYAQAYNNLGAALAKQGKLFEATKNYERVLELRPNDAEAYYNLGVALDEQGKLPEAIADYQQAIRLKPDYAKAYNNLGVALAQQGELFEATKNYQRVLELRPNDAEAYYNLGVALAEQAQLPEAIADYEQAIKLKPDYAEAYNNLGSALLGQGKLPEAIENYEQAIKLKPEYAEAYNNLGVVLARQGELPRAIQRYERAIQLKPDYAEAYYNLGLSHSEQGKLPEAVADYEQAIKLKPDYAEAYNDLGIALVEQGNLAAAIQNFERALQLKPNYTEAYNNLHIILERQEKRP
jgi:protein O-mannosyl-transferase